MSTDEQYLWAWKKAGMKDEVIAARLHMDVNQVAIEFAEIEGMIKDQKDAGIENLINQFNLTCLQYQVLGERIKEIAAGFSGCASPQEIKEKLKSNPEETVQSLMSSFIILHPWKSLEDQASN
jgi:hypothetical protein